MFSSLFPGMFWVRERRERVVIFDHFNNVMENEELRINLVLIRGFELIQNDSKN